uniref:Uncharacterized protein n=1 Tax=Arundo donax TaxID=35708 RepID=A0A0A8YPS1_ARUDO
MLLSKLTRGSNSPRKVLLPLSFRMNQLTRIQGLFLAVHCTLGEDGLMGLI